MVKVAVKNIARKMANGEPSTGTVKSYNREKGFGFIAADGTGEDVFFGRQILPSSLLHLESKQVVGRKVSFFASKADGKFQASELQENLDEQISGTIKSYNGAKAFGFIVTDGVDGDILFLKRDLPPVYQDRQKDFFEIINRPVRFDIVIGNDGKQLAKNISPIVDGDDALLLGHIKSYSEKNGFGFLQAPGVQEDVFFKLKFVPPHLKDSLRGQAVRFSLRMTAEGKYQAAKLAFLSSFQGKAAWGSGGGAPFMAGMTHTMSAMGGANAGSKGMMRSVQAGGVKTGTVKSFSEQNGWGFLSVPGQPGDVYYQARDFPNARSVGQKVTFKVHKTPDGKIRASNVGSSTPALGQNGGLKRTNPNSALNLAKKMKLMN